ncbi:MAG: deoxyribodipyrimidine photo-lyase [Acidobacteriota bacterium]|nr:deoxyribodipyrimidine photo-lyase [Acidobacteriota bacterium]
MGKSPPELKKRARKLNDQAVRSKAKYVLCWLQQNIRAFDNPAIDAAIATANKLKLPVVVYHGLGQKYPNANDRIHQFIIEAAKSLAPEVEKRGVRCINYIERPAKFEKGLIYRLAKDAAAIITDDQPAYVGRWQAERVAAKTDVAVFAVDASCIVPMNEFPYLTDANAFFRRAHTPLREKYLNAKTEMSPDVSRYQGEFDFEPDDLSKINLLKLVAECEIDHTVKPVEHFTGSREAALKQLKWACETVLPVYEKVRSNPSHLLSGTRLSPFLHFGVLSAREVIWAFQQHATDKQKNWRISDEIMSWREFFHHQARFETDPAAYETLPVWARETLEKHAAERSDSPTLDQIIHGETEDETWNAAQKQYLLEAWMPNNIRMYWGKKLVGWGKTPQEAWRTACYLNDRFSLDGRDSSTYGNIGWCFGKLNHPSGEKEIYGKVSRPWDATMRKRAGVSEWLAEQAKRETDRVFVPESI